MSPTDFQPTDALDNKTDHLDGRLFPPSLVKSVDLTDRARSASLPREAPFQNDGRLEGVFEKLTRALHRRKTRHVMLVGEKGVGRETIVAELARRAVTSSGTWLFDKRFVWADARYSPPGEGRPRVEAILQHVSRHPEVILCLEGLPSLLLGDPGMDHRLVLLSILSQIPNQLIVVVTPREYESLVVDLPDMLEFFNRVDLEEPDVETAHKLLRHFASGLEQSFRLSIQEEAVHQSVTLSANYILNERLPAKALKILHRCCENLDYERKLQHHSRSQVTADDVLAEVSNLSGVPEETLRGIAEKSDYETSLQEFIVGQDAAVREAATELGLIKAGLTDPDKPASVMLFVGQTGTGKTELAKALARFYSRSKRLQTYTMANFIEPHSVSGIIGVPAGYVGHSQGGRLINDLNADPYCVVLLDEADKAHPDVLQPFLNLFDEGWVRDQRGAKAYGDKAIFILTTNVGQKMIGDLVRQGESMATIREKMKAALTQIRHSKSNRPVFTPEFLARIGRIIVFEPLTGEAMEGNCRKLVREMQDTWHQKRERKLRISDALIAHIAEESHRKNEKSGGKEGGRIVRRLLRDLVEAKVQTAASEDPEGYRAAKVVKVAIPRRRKGGKGDKPQSPEVNVQFQK